MLAEFVGVQRQRVPALSAVHVDGERLYRRARRGEEVELPEREVTIHGLRLVEDLGGGRVVVEVRCGAGTYVRRLAGDIGERLGCGAYCAALRRTRVGALSVEDAVPVEQVGPEGGLDPRRGLAHLPSRELSAPEAERVRHGGRIDAAPRRRGAGGAGERGPPGGDRRAPRRAGCARASCWRIRGEALPVLRRPAARGAAARGRDRDLRRRPRGPPGRHPPGDRAGRRAAPARDGDDLRAPADRRAAPRAAARAC